MDLLADVCLLQQQLPNPKVIHLKNFNSMVKRAKEMSHVNLRFFKLKDVRFLASSDAAWGNATEFKSQMGHIIWAANGDIIDRGSVMCPISWQSKKQPRIANSTLSAEAMACGVSVDELDYVNAIWNEMIDYHFKLREWLMGKGERIDKQLKQSGIITVDAKCLYDSINGAGTRIPSCKRTALEVAMINETIMKNEHKLRWVPTGEMLGDALTKIGKKAERLYQVLRGDKYHLTELTQADNDDFQINYIMT
jgi:hypothetical protein